MSLDASLSWQASAAGTPTSYTVVWSHNGTAQPPITVPATAAQDASGYSQDFASANPTITVAAGDVIGATVTAVDGVHSLSSAVQPSTPPTVTEPTEPVPPSVPLNVTLVLA